MSTKASTAKKTEEPTDNVDDLKNIVTDQIADLQDTAQEISDQLAKSVEGATDQGMKFVRENPGVALAGAVGLGVLLGLAMSNRR